MASGTLDLLISEASLLNGACHGYVLDADPRLDPGDEPQPSYSPDPCFAGLLGFDDRQAVDRLISSWVILRADVTELANTTVHSLQSSSSNISTLIDLCCKVEQKQDQLRKLDGQIQNLLDFDNFVKVLKSG